MKIKTKFLYILLGSSMVLSSCNSLLDRPSLDQITDGSGLYWRDENDLRLFANGFYTQYFNGYNSSFTTDYTPVRGYTFSDDLTFSGQQANFENAIPDTRSSTSEVAAWLDTYAGPTWNYSWVRKSNIFLNRIETIAKPNLTTAQYNHWTAVAKFFKAFEYSRLVSVFGDVPYFESEVSASDFDTQYKDRDNRGVVMDHVYDDFVYVLQNMKADDGANVLNKYIAASFISRLMLFEGSWQKYHGLDQVRAKKYLELAQSAAEVVMSSGKYSFTADFKSLFSSQDLATNKEVIMYRKYDASVSVLHAIGSYQNGIEAQATAPNLKLIKEFICIDGKPYSSSSLASAADFSLSKLATSRDPRFEASFDTDLNSKASTFVYGTKYVARNGYKITSANPDYSKWNSNTNTSDAPVIRYGEVVLNWIEAKQILAENFGGGAVTQTDLDKSINAVRNRPLDEAAIAKGVTKTAPLQIGSIANDPARDADVTPLMWEIRRERRMEFVFEYSRLLDLKRWKKLGYMDFSKSTDYFTGIWVDVAKQAPDFLKSNYVGVTKVRKADGTVVTYNGSNAADMVGFIVVQNAANRNAVDDKFYLAPVGKAQIVDYEQRGYKLTQTKGW
ncbi:RagB/SusD family nutrient uptake outer membrane protein [Sphingobacterium paramultivorum]|uniref:RagB/SusD family nutrient uptake outer membrane protein n=1 Tax=Sphingobacterium paramultivorum TaxID=2886510 RepID=A0A7G5E871_9SPHI|nr:MULTISPECIES: RagB/SusD family nutrient uptake outer membrane protein [Sphingobacterium]MCS4166593.1 hypothetical protein [Sphingobacterium sp. BIGb0116]QMV70196.1 RagB/SusD family nutrient uptake outer membrane protein [Sphingobacterium paramultivorum]WSO14038.1 RagB/SusD family nutrient uptake outer membrane protein [Sphingobacterium paramultivorum]